MTAQSTPGRKIKPRMLVSVIVFLLYTPLALFISSGKLDWWMAWLYALLSVVLSLGSRVMMARKHPDLVAERASYREAQGVKEWDRKLVKRFCLNIQNPESSERSPYVSLGRRPLQCYHKIQYLRGFNLSASQVA